MQARLDHQRMTFWIVMLLLGQLVWGAAHLHAAELTSAADAKAAFDAAMAKPLAERVPALEALEQGIDTLLFEGSLTGKDRVQVLLIKYQAQVNQAKYPESHASFGQYAQALWEWPQRERARATLVEQVRHARLMEDRVQCMAIADAALKHWGSDEQVAPALIYMKARSVSELPGRAQEAIEPLQTVITNYPDSPWRPQAMRWLAHLEGNGFGEGEDAALGVLALMETQYTGTWWAQYANMKPAMIWEVRRGEPQKALEIYQQTLETYPDHKFATFCRAQIERLQGVIENQLIQDALEGLAQADEVNQEAPSPRLMLPDDHLLTRAD